MNDMQPTIPIWRTVVTAYRHGVGVLFRDGALFRYFVYAALLSAVVFGVHLYRVRLSLAVSADETPPGNLIANIATGIVLYVAYAAAITPFAFAVYRKLLLGETPRELYLVALTRRGQRQFLLATIAVYAIFLIAAFASHPVLYLVYGLNPFSRPALMRAYAVHPALSLVVGVLTWASYSVAALIAARFAFAFPAIATHVPDTRLRQSFAETRGLTWRLFFIFLLIFALPILMFFIAIIIASIAFFIGHPESARAPNAVVGAIMFSTPFLVIYGAMFIGMIMTISVTAAATARVYDAKINRGLTGVAEVFT